MPRLIKSRWSKRAKRLGTTQTDLLFVHSSIPFWIGGLCLTILVLQDPFDQDDWDAYKQFMAEVGKDLSFFFCQQIECSAEMTVSIICWTETLWGSWKQIWFVWFTDTAEPSSLSKQPLPTSRINKSLEMICSSPIPTASRKLWKLALVMRCFWKWTSILVLKSLGLAGLLLFFGVWFWVVVKWELAYLVKVWSWISYFFWKVLNGDNECR